MTDVKRDLFIWKEPYIDESRPTYRKRDLYNWKVTYKLDPRDQTGHLEYHLDLLFLGLFSNA